MFQTTNQNTWLIFRHEYVELPKGNQQELVKLELIFFRANLDSCAWPL